jgi:DNA-binding response OmpR family regulator
MTEQPVPNPSVQRILVVDDAVDLRYLLTLRLQRAGYVVMAAGSSAEALALVRQQGLPALALVDLVLPGVDGLTLAQELCRLGHVPILLLSALSDPPPKGGALGRCVQGYLLKPFLWAEVLARVQWVLAQEVPAASAPQAVAIDDHLTIDFDHRYAVFDQRRIKLTPTESRLLHLFYCRRGQVLSPGALLAEAWAASIPGTLRSLWVHIRRLRIKLEPDPQHPCYIVTVRGLGYSLPPPDAPAPVLREGAVPPAQQVGRVPISGDWRHSLRADTPGNPR